MISLVCQKLPGQASYYSKYRTQTRLDYPTILPAIINFIAFRKKIGKLPQPKINHSINLKIIWFWSYCNMNTKGVKTVVWWGPHRPNFPLSLYLYLYYIKNIWKQTYYFQFFVGGGLSSTKVVVTWDACNSMPSGRAIWQLSDAPYHTEFVSGHEDNFSFSFSYLGGGWVVFGP